MKDSNPETVVMHFPPVIPMKNASNITQDTRINNNTYPNEETPLPHSDLPLLDDSYD